jgi:CRP-like cAMP-binding protein
VIEESMAGIPGSSPSNLLLASFSPADLAAIGPHLETTALPLRYICYDKDEPIEYIYFPLRGLVSLLMPLEDGGLMEVGIIGKEGVVGLSALTGYKLSLHTAMVQLPGNAMRIRASVLHEQSTRSPSLMTQLLLFSQALYAQLSYTAICPIRHNLSQRLARWLLMMLDRAEDDVLPLTQEFMAMMLGARRPGVTVAANMLQDGGAITYDRGRVTIRDRHLLEQNACECYAAQRDIYRQLLNWPTS